MKPNHQQDKEHQESDEDKELSKDEADEGYQYASLNRRFFASLIDSAVLMIALVPIIAGLGGVFFPELQSPEGQQKLQQAFYNAQHSTDPAVGVIDAVNLAISMGWLSKTLIELLASAIILIGFWRLLSSTPGKILLGMKIIDFKTGNDVSTIQAIKRFLGSIIAVMFFFIGVFWILFDKKRQGWHDKIAGTVVVKI